MGSEMLTPCEVAVKCLLPVFRAKIASNIRDKYKLSQCEIAKLLGVSQPAISLYSKKLRGKALDLNDSEITALIETLSESLVSGSKTKKDLLIATCKICMISRSKGLMCELHKALDESVDVKSCGLCKEFLTCCIEK
jgi:predicted transcriptional regulator